MIKLSGDDMGHITDKPGQFFVMESAQHITGNLWLGSHPSNIRDYQFVVNLDGKPRYGIENKQTVLIKPFYDIAEMPDVDMLHDLAKTVLEMGSVGKTLVHCQAGLNRSGLVMALALMHDGMTAVDAIALLREKRVSDVLFNSTFENWLLELKL